MTAMESIAIETTEVGNSESEIESVHQRLSLMSNPELLRFGVITSCKSLRTPLSDRHKKETLVMQLSEARAEWKRRFPELTLSESF